MKRLIATLIAWGLFACMLPAQSGNPAQGEAMLTLQVRTPQGAGLAKQDVEFIETRTRERIVLKTDDKGQLQHHFKTGRYWQINIADIRNYFFWQIEVKPAAKMRLSKTITYDFKRYERETRPAVNRAQLHLSTEAQRFTVDEKATKELGIIHLTIKKGDGSPLSRYPVAITSYQLRKTFTAETNPAGIAVFKVPLDQEYEIDIDGIESFSYIDLPATPGYRATRGFTYEPTVITEKVVRDTVTQDLPDGQEGTSGSVMTRITLKGGPDGVWKNEPVFLEVLGEKKWYKATTNLNGEAGFLIPKGKQYMIHGRFEKRLDVIDLRRRRGIGYSNKVVLYRPLEKYQFPGRYIPQPQDLIVQAFQHFLDQQYPMPEGDDYVRLDASFTGPVGPGSKEAVLRLAVTASEPKNHGAAPPLNLSLVIDKSGSMAGDERIGHLKTSLSALVARLRPSDILSIVIFEDFETVVIPAQRVGTDRSKMDVVIRNIEAGGGTNIYKGMMAGYKECMKNVKKGINSRILVLSDGYGVTPIDSIFDAQKPFTAKGIDCSTVGVGEDYNFALLEQMATNGGGHISHVGDASNLTSVFLEEVLNSIYPVAEDVTIEVLYNKHLEYRHLYGYPLKERSGRRLVLKLDDLYAGSNQLAFVRFDLPDPTPEVENEPVTIRIKYKDLITGQVVSQEQQVSLEWQESAGPGLANVIEAREKRLYSIAVMNQSLKAMSDKFHGGDLAGAKQALRDGLATLEKTYPNAKEEEVLALRESLENYLDVLDKQ